MNPCKLTTSRTDLWPVHPGLEIKAFLKDRRMTVRNAASALGIGHVALSNVLNGKAGISPQMALRFETVGWASAEACVKRQALYDLAMVRQQTQLAKIQTAHDVLLQRQALAQRQMLKETLGNLKTTGNSYAD